MGAEVVGSCARPGGARFGVQDHRSLGGGRWRVDMTAFARFSMASRSMRDATNLAGSQGCSARLRKLDNTTQRPGWISSSRPTLSHIAALFLLPCIYFCLSVSSPANLRILRYRPGPPQRNLDSLLYHRFMHACDLARQAGFLTPGKTQDSSQCQQQRIRFMYIPSEYSSLRKSIDLPHDTPFLEPLELPVGSH